MLLTKTEWDFLRDKAIAVESGNIENAIAYTRLLLRKVKYEWDSLSEVEKLYIKYLVYSSFNKVEKGGFLSGLKYRLIYIYKRLKYGKIYDEYLNLIDEATKEILNRIERENEKYVKDLKEGVKEALKQSKPLKGGVSAQFSHLLED